MSIRALVSSVLFCSAVAYGQSGSTVTPADYLRWRTELRNWGRWGPDDELGTLNLITEAKRIASAELHRGDKIRACLRA